MKKHTLLLCILICACRSITYQDVNPTISPNANLLPSLETLIDIYNLESTYSSGSFNGSANSFGSGYVNSSGFGNSFQSTSINGNYYKDARVSDIINIFEKEVKENISTPYGAKKGYISLKIGYRGSEDSWTYCIVSTLSYFTLPLVGFPWDKIDESLEVEVQIMNNKKEVIKIYREDIYNSSYVAMWWGYNGNNAYRKVAADNIKQALEKIRIRIGNDATEIKNKLK